MAAQFATYSLIATMLRERFGVTLGQVSFALMVFGVGGVVSNMLIGRIGDRLSVETLIRGSQAVRAAVFVAFLAPSRGRAELTAPHIARVYGWWR